MMNRDMLTYLVPTDLEVQVILSLTPASSTGKDMFPDGSVFKEVKYLDIDNADPTNIKFKPK